MVMNKIKKIQDQNDDGNYASDKNYQHISKPQSSFNLPTVVCSFSMLLHSLLYLVVKQMLRGKE